jgi:hypothetical protein
MSEENAKRAKGSQRGRSDKRGQAEAPVLSRVRLAEGWRRLMERQRVQVRHFGTADR